MTNIAIKPFPESKHPISSDLAAVLSEYKQVSALCSTHPETMLYSSRLKELKEIYLSLVHTREISQMTKASGRWHGYWCTKIYKNGKRQPLRGKTYEELQDKLFEFYSAKHLVSQSLSEVFEHYMQYKKDSLVRSPSTIADDRRMFRLIDESIRMCPIDAITSETIQAWIDKVFMQTIPTESALKKQVQIIDQTFRFGQQKQYCENNPMITVDVKKHYHFCRPSGKPESEKGFTDEEVRILCSDGEKNHSNPRALMRVFAAETGVRAGEVVAIHKSDCGEQYVHIHRQQVKNTDSDGHIVFEEVQYTKDERVHPHNGRLVPLSARAKAIIHIASQLSGDSELLFCDKNSMMISKDSYAQNLKRACERLGISTTNNHAFRMAFNGRMIDNGISASDRALILGHSIATNEKYYSNRDKRRLDAVRQQLFCETSSETIVP